MNSMKKFTGILLVTLSVIAVSCGTSKNAATGSGEDYMAFISKAVAEKNFKINVNTAFPQGARMVSLSSPYSLEIKGDSVYSYLPFFGRAYRVPYSGSVGLNFDGVLTDYNVTRGKKNETIVKFNVISPEDRHDYMVEIWDNGNSSVYVNSVNRQSISFEGRMDTKAIGE